MIDEHLPCKNQSAGPELTDPDKFEFDRKIRSVGLWGGGYGRKQKTIDRRSPCHSV